MRAKVLNLNELIINKHNVKSLPLKVAQRLHKCGVKQNLSTPPRFNVSNEIKTPQTLLFRGFSFLMMSVEVDHESIALILEK